MQPTTQPGNVIQTAKEVLDYWPMLTALSFVYGLLVLTGQMMYFGVNPIGVITPNDLAVTTVIFFSSLFVFISYTVAQYGPAATLYSRSYGWGSFFLVAVFWLLALGILFVPAPWLQQLQDAAKPGREAIAHFLRIPNWPIDVQSTKDAGWFFVGAAVIVTALAFWRVVAGGVQSRPLLAIPLVALASAGAALGLGYLSSDLMRKYNPTYEFVGTVPPGLAACPGTVRLTYSTERMSVMQCACGGPYVVNIGDVDFSLRLAPTPRCPAQSTRSQSTRASPAATQSDEQQPGR